MSKYYKLEKPFSIANWNLLIDDINAKLQHPPDSNCSAVASLEKVTPPHRWAAKDVIDTREALKKTCPDIDFSEELILWKSKIIDELETALGKAWCKCTGGEKVVDLGTFCSQLVEGSYKPQGVLTYAPCGICPGLCAQNDVESPQNFCDYIAFNKNVCQEIVDNRFVEIAIEETQKFITAVNTCMLESQYMQESQDKLDVIKSQLTTLSNQWTAAGCDLPHPPNPSTCAEICVNFNTKYADGQALQALVDEHHGKFLASFLKINPAMEAANTAAGEVFSRAMSLEVRWPGVDQNWWTSFGPGIVNLKLKWWEWFNPETDSQVSCLTSFAAYGNPPDPTTTCDKNPCGDCCIHVDGRSGCGVRPKVDAEIYNVTEDSKITFNTILVSPDGTPFITSMYHLEYLFQYEYGLPWFYQRWRYKCEQIIATWYCDQFGGLCEWEPWSPLGKSYWACGCKCNGIYYPLEPHKTGDYPCHTPRLRYTLPPGKSIGDKYPEEKERFFTGYGALWYDDNPKLKRSDYDCC